MNKRKVDDLIPKAVEILTDTGIVNKEGKIKKTFLLLGTVTLRVIILLVMVTMNPT